MKKRREKPNAFKQMIKWWITPQSTYEERKE